jgi:hypothetical protein
MMSGREMPPLVHGGPHILLDTLFCLLALATSVWAECAWVVK